MTSQPQNIIPAGRAGKSNPVDEFCGKRIRQRRNLLGITQIELANSLGISFQQIQKYERGTNRISVSRLYDLSEILDCKIEYFFAEMPLEIKNQSPRLRAKIDKKININESVLEKRETLTLVQNYYKIKDEKTRKQIIKLCQTICEK